MGQYSIQTTPLSGSVFGANQQSCYANEMGLLQPVGAFIIGGNCQGAIIAEAVARALRASGRTVELLLLMEHRDFKPYEGRVALIFGRDS
jgi:hypothetical protein